MGNSRLLLLGIVAVGVAVVLLTSHRGFAPDWEPVAMEQRRLADDARAKARRAEDALADAKNALEKMKPEHADTPAPTTNTPLPPPSEAVIVEEDVVAVVDVAEEANVVPEDPRADDERSFKHFVQSLPELPADAPDEARSLRRAFLEYSRNRNAKTSIPVYGTACIGAADCRYVKDQFKSLDVGVGHVIVVLNRPHEEFQAYFAKIAAYFPGRFTYIYREVGGGCAESWNIMLRLGFSITPTPQFVMATNGDLWALPGYLAKFATYMRDNYPSQVGARFVDFSSFALNKKGWQQLGPFDEVIFPAYAEDVEYHIRAVSLGVNIGSFPGKRLDVSHRHAGSRSFTDKNFNVMYNRWDKNDYMFRKWNVDMAQYSDYARSHPFKHPWNQPSLSHRNSWVVDPKHRHCIRTGEGVKHEARQVRCRLSACASCFYNASVLRPLLPPGTKLPDSLLSVKRARL